MTMLDLMPTRQLVLLTVAAAAAMDDAMSRHYERVVFDEPVPTWDTRYKPRRFKRSQRRK